MIIITPSPGCTAEQTREIDRYWLIAVPFGHSPNIKTTSAHRLRRWPINNSTWDNDISREMTSSAVQSRKAVFAYFISKHIQPFGLHSIVLCLMGLVELKGRGP